MADLFLPPGFAGSNVILVNGVCYMNAGPSDEPPTPVGIEEEFETCGACQDSSDPCPGYTGTLNRATEITYDEGGVYYTADSATFADGALTTPSPSGGSLEVWSPDGTDAVEHNIPINPTTGYSLPYSTYTVVESIEGTELHSIVKYRYWYFGPCGQLVSFSDLMTQTS